MALTQVSTGGIKDGQIHTADLADGAISAAKFDTIALDITYTLGASGTNHYTFTGEGLTGAVNDPTLYLTRGKTYRFVNGNSAGAHPFRIQTTVNGSAGTEYNTGVTNNGGGGGSTIIFEVPHDAPDVLYYQCTSHGSMGGVFYITGALADSGVTTAKLADDAVTDAKLANSINAAIAANTAKTSNATHTGDVTGSTSLTIADSAVTTAKLADINVTTAKIADNAVTGDKVSDNLDIPDNNKIRFGTGNDLSIYHDGTNSTINNNTGDLFIQTNGNLKLEKKDGGSDYIHCIADGAVELHYDGSKKFETTSYGIKTDNLPRQIVQSHSTTSQVVGSSDVGLNCSNISITLKEANPKLVYTYTVGGELDGNRGQTFYRLFYSTSSNYSGETAATSYAMQGGGGSDGNNGGFNDSGAFIFNLTASAGTTIYLRLRYKQTDTAATEFLQSPLTGQPSGSTNASFIRVEEYAQ